MMRAVLKWYLGGLLNRNKPICGQGNSPDKLRHTSSVAYSAELAVLNKHQILGGRATMGSDIFRKLIKTELFASY